MLKPGNHLDLATDWIYLNPILKSLLMILELGQQILSSETTDIYTKTPDPQKFVMKDLAEDFWLSETSLRSKILIQMCIKVYWAVMQDLRCYKEIYN